VTEVVHDMEREQTQRQHGLDRIEVEGRQVIYTQEGVFREEVLDASPFGVGGHGRVNGQVARRCDQREIRAVAPFL